MKFSEMKYERPDVNQLVKEEQEFIEQFKQASNYQQAREIFINHDKSDRHLQTLVTLAQIRNSINTKDEFYAKEKEFWDEQLPNLQNVSQQWILTLLNSPFRQQLAQEFGDVTFINAEMALKTFSPEIIEELQQENKLTSEYDHLVASAQVDFRGKKYTISQLAPFKNSPDDETRYEAWQADGGWYKSNAKQLDEIYDKLTHLRDSMGRKLGYDGYKQLGYYRMSRNCYNEEDIKKFREAVVKYIVPLADKTYRDQAKRIGKEYPMSYADVALAFRDGNPKPVGTPDEILQVGKKFYDDLSPETSEFFNTMLDNELLDVLSTEGKQAGGYCTGIPDYNVPFIFANFNGTQHDVEVVTHEAGHAFEAYTNRNRIPVDTIWPSMEACEVHSMSMEFFAWSHVDDFFGKDANKYRYSHLAGALQFIPYGTMVDHFQHIVYEKPDMTPEQRNETWKELTAIYMPWVRLDGKIPFYSEGRAWQRQLHIYDSPFYYIDYCLAQTVALEFWAMIQKDKKNAWEHYYAYTKMGGSKTFVDLLKSAGLDTPFEEKCLKDVATTAAKWLDDFDLSKI